MDEEFVKRNAKILMVDDEEATVRLLERLLLREGYANLYSTVDSRRVPDLYREVEPDLIILDLHMPDWNGFVLLEELGAALHQEKYLPILMLTGDLSEEAKHQALVLGVKEFLTKPLDLFEARYRIWNLLHTRFLYLELERNAREQQRPERRTAAAPERNPSVGDEAPS
ncbi:MAG: response regulator [Longimicrobiaceae bacterium]